MVTKIDVTNVNGTYTIKLLDSEDTLLPVTNIEGLGPVEGSVNVGDLASTNGGKITSTRVATRNIVITMYLSSPKKSRKLLYKIFPTENNVTLRLYTDDGITYITEGVVESVVADYFGDMEGGQVSILCPDPYLYDVNDSYLKMSNSTTTTTSGTSDANETYTRLWGIDTTNNVAYIKATPSYIDKEYYQLVNKPVTYSKIEDGDYIVSTLNSQLVANVNGVNRNIYTVDGYVTIDHDDMYGNYDYFYESDDEYVKLSSYSDYDENRSYSKRIMKYAIPSEITDKNYSSYISYTSSALTALAARGITVGTGDHACSMIWNESTKSWTIKTPYMTAVANDGSASYDINIINTTGLTEISQSNAEIIFTLDYDAGFVLSATYGDDEVETADDLVSLRSGYGPDWTSNDYYIRDQYDAAVYRTCYAYDPDITYFVKISLTDELSYYKYVSAGYHWESVGSEYTASQASARYVPATYKDVSLDSMDDNTKYYIHKKINYVSTTSDSTDELYIKNTSSTAVSFNVANALNNSALTDSYTEYIVDDMLSDDAITISDSSITGTATTLSFMKYNAADSSSLYFKSSSTTPSSYSDRHTSTYNMYPAYHQTKTVQERQIGTGVNDIEFQAMCNDNYIQSGSTYAEVIQDDPYAYLYKKSNSTTTRAHIGEEGSGSDIERVLMDTFTKSTDSDAVYAYELCTSAFNNPQATVNYNGRTATLGSEYNNTVASTFFANSFGTKNYDTVTTVDAICNKQLVNATTKKQHYEYYYFNGAGNPATVAANFDGVYRSTYYRTSDSTWQSNKDYYIGTGGRIDGMFPSAYNSGGTSQTTVFKKIPALSQTANSSAVLYSKQIYCRKSDKVEWTGLTGSSALSFLPTRGGALHKTSDTTPVVGKQYLRLLRKTYIFEPDTTVEDTASLNSGTTYYTHVAPADSSTTNRMEVITTYTSGASGGYYKIVDTAQSASSNIAYIYAQKAGDGTYTILAGGTGQVVANPGDEYITDATVTFNDGDFDKYGYATNFVTATADTSLTDLYDASELEYYEYYIRALVDDYDVKLQDSCLEMYISSVFSGNPVIAKFAGIPKYTEATGITEFASGTTYYIFENGTYTSVAASAAFDSTSVYYTKTQDEFTYIPYNSDLVSTIKCYVPTVTIGTSEAPTLTYEEKSLAQIQSALGITEARYPTLDEMNSKGIMAFYCPTTNLVNYTNRFAKELYLMPSIPRLKMMLYDKWDGSVASATNLDAYISTSNYPTSDYISTIMAYGLFSHYAPADSSTTTRYKYSNASTFITDLAIYVTSPSYGTEHELIPFIASKAYYIRNDDDTAWIQITPSTKTNRSSLYHANYSGKMAYYRFTSNYIVPEDSYLCTSNYFDIVAPYKYVTAAEAASYTNLYNINFDTYTLATSYDGDTLYSVPVTYSSATLNTDYAYDDDAEAYVSSTVLYCYYPKDSYYTYSGSVSGMTVGEYYTLTVDVSDQIYSDGKLFKLGNYAYMENTTGTSLYPKITITMNKDEDWKDLDIYVKDTDYNVIKHSKIDVSKFALSSASAFETTCSQYDKIVIDTKKRSIKYYKYDGGNYTTYNMLYSYVLVEANTPTYGKRYAYTSAWPDVPQGIYLMTISTQMAITVEYSFKTGYEGL